jgi:hypothetical protein
MSGCIECDENDLPNCVHVAQPQQSEMTFEQWWESTGIDRHSGNYDAHRTDQNRKADAKAGWDAHVVLHSRPLSPEMVERIAQAISHGLSIPGHSVCQHSTETVIGIIQEVLRQ